MALAVYPFATTVVRGTTVRETLPPILDRSVVGGARGRSFAVLFPRQFKLFHVLDAEGLNDLQTFYDDNRELQFDFVWQRTGETVTTYFLAAPAYVTVRADLYEASVTLVEDVITDPNARNF